MISIGLNCLSWHFGDCQLPWKGAGGFCLLTPPVSSCLCSVCGLSTILRLSCHFGLVSQITVINANSQHELWAAQMLDNPWAGREPSFCISWVTQTSFNTKESLPQAQNSVILKWLRHPSKLKDSLLVFDINVMATFFSEDKNNETVHKQMASGEKGLTPRVILIFTRGFSIKSKPLSSLLLNGVVFSN